MIPLKRINLTLELPHTHAPMYWIVISNNNEIVIGVEPKVCRGKQVINTYLIIIIK